jgi:hypothetical protein
MLGLVHWSHKTPLSGVPSEGHRGVPTPCGRHTSGGDDAPTTRGEVPLSSVSSRMPIGCAAPKSVPPAPFKHTPARTQPLRSGALDLVQIFGPAPRPRSSSPARPRRRPIAAECPTLVFNEQENRTSSVGAFNVVGAGQPRKERSDVRVVTRGVLAGLGGSGRSRAPGRMSAPLGVAFLGFPALEGPGGHGHRPHLGPAPSGKFLLRRGRAHPVGAFQPCKDPSWPHHPRRIWRAGTTGP